MKALRYTGAICLWLFQCWHLTLAAVLELSPPLKKRREGHALPLCLSDTSNKDNCLKDIWMEGMKSKSALDGGCCDGVKKNNNNLEMGAPGHIVFYTQFSFSVCHQRLTEKSGQKLERLSFPIHLSIRG